MKILQTLFLALTLIAFSMGTLWAAGPQSQTKCPVLAGNIDKQVYTDYKGKRIYFCCKGCDEEFKKDPEKYLKKMQDEGVTPGPIPAGPQ